MGILPMVCLFLLFSLGHNNSNNKDMGKMPMLHS